MSDQKTINAALAAAGRDSDRRKAKQDLESAIRQAVKPLQQQLANLRSESLPLRVVRRGHVNSHVATVDVFLLKQREYTRAATLTSADPRTQSKV